MTTQPSPAKKIARVGILIALCVVGALIKIPSPTGSVALDAAPAFLAAFAFTLPEAALVAVLGHLVSAATAGFPLSLPVHAIIAITMAVRGHPRAPDVAIFTGAGSAVLFTYAHLLPNFWPDFQDSYLSGPRINVTWFSWVTALSEIGTGLLFAYAGLRARRASASRRC